MRSGFPSSRAAIAAARSVTAIALVCACSAVSSGTASAQELTLNDGRVLVGKFATVGDVVRVTTRDGQVQVPADAVVRTRSREELGAELRGLAKRHAKRDSAFAQLELAKLARRYGLKGAMWRHLNQSLADEDASGATRRRIDDVLRSLEPELLSVEQRALPNDKKVRRLTRLARGKRDAKVRAIESILASLDGADAALRKTARRAGSPLQRLTAVRALERRNDAKFVLRTAILDSSEDVRRGAAEAASQGGHTETAVRYLSPGLISRSTKVATRTAEAFANLGDPAAVPLLVRAGPIAASAPPPGSTPGGATRGFIAVTTQQSYIRDFDVEVAQAAFIADPKVDIVQSGVVFDATVLASITQRVRVTQVYRKALKRLTGSDPGKDTRFWAGWYAQRFPGGGDVPAENQQGS